MKGPPRESDEHIGPVVRPSPGYGRAPTGNEAIKRVTGSLPRVGNLVIKGERPIVSGLSHACSRT